MSSHFPPHRAPGVGTPVRPDWLDTGALDDVLSAIAREAARYDRDNAFAAEAFLPLHELGVFRLTAPLSHNGYAGGLALSAEVTARIGAADPSVGLVTLWQFLFLAELARSEPQWPTALRKAILSSARDGLALINAANVEPELGTPIRGGLPATTATRQPDGSWLVRGRKSYATGIPLLRWLLVPATVHHPAPHARAFVIDTRDGGFRVEETWDSIGLRASATHDVILEHVVVAEGAVLLPDDAQPGAPPSYASRRLGWASVLLSALYNGIAHAARDWLVRYLNERTPTNLGAPLATLPRFQQAVGSIEALLGANDRLIADVAAAVDRPPGPARDEALRFAPLLKHLVTSNVKAITSTALELTGNPGHSRANPLERHHRDALTGSVHTPQADFALAGAGRFALERAAADSRARAERLAQ